MKAPSAAFVGRRASWLVLFLAFVGWLLLRAVIALADAAERVYIEMDRQAWADIFGAVLIFPIALGLVLVLALGRDALTDVLTVLSIRLP